MPDDLIIIDQHAAPGPQVLGECCPGCPQEYVGRRRVLPDGHGTSGIVLVGDSPWDNEVREGKPFAGPAGYFLDKHIFRRLGVKRGDFLLTNAMWCSPPHLNWTDRGGEDVAHALQRCSPYLDRLIESTQPKVLVAMGNVAMRRLIGMDGIMRLQAYTMDSVYGIPVIPTFHPSFVMQDNHKYSPAMLFAFRKAQQIAAAGGKWHREPVDYCLDRSLPELKAWMLRHGWQKGMPLAVDIETPETAKLDEDEAGENASYHIIRCGFSFKANTAATFPWEEPYISLLQDLLATGGAVVFHNGSFDQPRLEAAGCRITGRVYDTMWMWHWLQSDLPKALEFVAPFHTDLAPWKHLSQAQPDYYNAVDNDACIRLYYRLREVIEKQGRWERFERHCVDAGAILRRMGQRGICVDTEARSKLMDELQAGVDKLDAEIQQLVPQSVCPSKILKTDRTIKVLPPEQQAQWQVFMQQCECVKPGLFGEPAPTGLTAEGKKCGCKGTGTLVRFRTAQRFNWNSRPQVLELAAHYKLKVPKKRGEDHEAADAKFLKSAGKKHRIFKLMLTARQQGKLLSTYNWPLTTDNRALTVYGFHPSTWRKSSRRHNLQNIPKRNDLAEAYRRCLVASPGCVLVEADSSAIEAVLVGYGARSPRMIALAKAGVHDWFMSWVRAARDGGSGIDPELPFDQLVAACHAAKKYDKSLPAAEQLRESCKRCIHGTHYGLTPFGMADEYPDEFPTQKVAEQMQSMYLDLLPEIKQWMRDTAERADRQTWLDNHFNYRHYFFSVSVWDSKKQGYKAGPDRKRAIAFGPQSDGSAIQTEYLLQLAAMPRIEPWLRLIIHDSFVLDVPEDEAEYACQTVHDVMSQPFAELGGLSIGVEVKVGPNLADQVVWEPKHMQAGAEL